MDDITALKADFRLFLVMWNQAQNLKTPPLHLRIAQWLEARWRAGERHLLLMAFRSAGKSTLVGVFAAWLLHRDPNLRILVLAADSMLAKKMVRNVKRIIERHPLTAHLKPDKADQWAADRFTVRRELELRDASMSARGVTSNITGSRADVVICDDVEVPNTCDSAEKRAELRERLAEMRYVLAAGGTQIYVGTPHHYYSIYADSPRREVGEEFPFLDGFDRLLVPILDDEGQSAWPERYAREDIERLKIATGPNKFDSQMMLRAVNIMEGRLNPDLLQFYKAEVEYVRELGVLYIGGRKMVDARSWWDPSFGGARGDASVLAVVFGDEGGDYYLHHVAYIRTDEKDSRNEAAQQCARVCAIARQLHLPSIAVEMNGIGRFLPNILRNTLTKAGVPARVQEVNSSRAKAVRIIEGFDAVMAAKRLYVHEDVCKTPFIAEMREWRPSDKNARDDALDAVAGALSLHPDRLERFFGKGGQSWMRGGMARHHVKTDFEV